MTPGHDELEEWHRFFAIENNNIAWEMAFVHTIHAHAAAVAGKHDAHLERYRVAEHAIEAISDDEDRRIVLQTFSQVPTPGGDA